MGLRPPRYPLHFPAQEGERKATPGVSSTPSPTDAPTAPTWPTQDAGLGSALGKRRNHTKAPPGTLRPGSAAGRRMFIEGVGLGEHREALMEAGGGGGAIRKGREVVKETAGRWGAGRTPPPCPAPREFREISSWRLLLCDVRERLLYYGMQDMVSRFSAPKPPTPIIEGRVQEEGREERALELGFEGCIGVCCFLSSRSTWLGEGDRAGHRPLKPCVARSWGPQRTPASSLWGSSPYFLRASRTLGGQSGAKRVGSGPGSLEPHGEGRGSGGLR